MCNHQGITSRNACQRRRNALRRLQIVMGVIVEEDMPVDKIRQEKINNKSRVKYSSRIRKIKHWIKKTQNEIDEVNKELKQKKRQKLKEK